MAEVHRGLGILCFLCKVSAFWVICITWTFAVFTVPVYGLKVGGILVCFFDNRFFSYANLEGFVRDLYLMLDTPFQTQ